MLRVRHRSQEMISRDLRKIAFRLGEQNRPTGMLKTTERCCWPMVVLGHGVLGQMIVSITLETSSARFLEASIWGRTSVSIDYDFKEVF